MDKKSFTSNSMTLTFMLLGAVIFLFIIVPLIKMIVASDPKLLLETALDSEVISSIGLTLYAALIATIIGFLLGVPLAYLLARVDFLGKNLVEGLIDVPIVVPHIAAGIALLFVFGRSSLAGKAFHLIGIDFFDSVAGIVVAMLFVSIPFLIDSAKEGFKKVDVRLEKVARSLGASPWQSFFKISLPLAWRSIIAGILAYHPMVASTLIYERFEGYGLDYAQPVAVLLILVCLTSFIAIRLLVYRGQKT